MVSSLFHNLTPLVLTATIMIIMVLLRVSIRVMQNVFFPSVEFSRAILKRGKVSKRGVFKRKTVHVESHLYDFLLEPATLVQALPL